MENSIICNLISLTTMAIADIYNGTSNVANKVEQALNNSMLYGNVPQDIREHIIGVINANDAYHREHSR